MGMDIFGIVSHNLSAKEAVLLPEMIKTWNEIFIIKSEPSLAHPDFKLKSLQKSQWENTAISNEFILNQIWEIREGSIPETKEANGCDTTIDCFVGDIKVYRNTLTITHSPEHKYANIWHPERATRIIIINRKIAEFFGGKEVIYCPDGGYPTAILIDYALEGKTFESIKELGYKKFGLPPRGIAEGRKNMFFIDNIDDEIGEITEWTDDGDYWRYNYETNEYVQTKNCM
jgi:hypothetical protein